MFWEVMDVQREVVPNRRMQADTNSRQMARTEMSRAMRSPTGPLRREGKGCGLSRLSHAGPWPLEQLSPVGVFDAAAVDPEEQEEEAVQGQEP